jgi:hypothetical protein
MSDVPHITQNFARPSYRPEAQAGMDPDMRRMALVAGGLGAAVAVLIAIVSLSHHAHRGIPVIEAAFGPVRVKPLDPGGMKVAGAEEAASGVEALAPAAEKPALRALHAKTRVPTAPHPASLSEARPAAAPVVASAAPVQKASATQALPVAASVAPRGTTVQLAAFESQQAAEQDWGKMAEKIPGLFDGHRPQVERAQLAGRTVYRLRTAGFADIASANAFCGKVRAKGGDCSIAAF